MTHDKNVLKFECHACPSKDYKIFLKYFSVLAKVINEFEFGRATSALNKFQSEKSRYFQIRSYLLASISYFDKRYTCFKIYGPIQRDDVYGAILFSICIPWMPFFEPKRFQI